MRTKNISTFLFRKAQYLTVDKHGNEIVLEIDYWNNDFQLVGNIIDNEIRNELSLIARDLLKRKHKKNFAEI